MVLRSLLKMGMHNTFFTSVESYQPNMMFATFHYLTHVCVCIYIYIYVLTDPSCTARAVLSSCTGCNVYIHEGYLCAVNASITQNSPFH